MALKYADRIKQITTTPPTTNPFALVTTPATFFAFSSYLSTGDTTFYEADDGSANTEIGLGTYTAANTLTRTTIYKSSNSGSPCNFANNVTVICTAPASRLALLTAAGIMPAVDGSLLTNLTLANIAGIGQAAAKTVSDNTKATVASVAAAVVAGNIATFNDTAGTVKDSGFAPAYFAPATIISSSGPSGSAPQGTLWAVV